MKHTSGTAAKLRWRRLVDGVPDTGVPNPTQETTAALASAESRKREEEPCGHGFLTGSSTERLPIERAVLATAKEFRDLKFNK